ncbi:MAG: hypothetical protein EP330_20850 [Deltaproteobacteria bacterium]|nr:MAG: hypothetical protein EP330_20850 [Deltaproteobacteria bacterium]
MILELATGITGFVVTLGGGLFAMSMAERASDLFSQPDMGPEPQKQQSTHVHTRWQPLDLEPYPMPWPSERPHEVRRLPEMKWPSESWDDPHFGPRKRGSQSKTDHMTSLTGNPRLSDGESPPVQATRARPKARPAPTPKPQPTPVEQPTIREPAVQSRMAAIAMEQARRLQAEQQRPQPKPAPKPQPVAQSAVPEAEVLRGWVAQYGLAGAVAKLRTQTGWDFQKAARYLAQQVSGRE